MNIFLFILFLISSSTATYLYLSYERKMLLYKRQLSITLKQYNILKNKSKILKDNKSNLSNTLKIRFSIPKYRSGTVIYNSNVFIAPLDNSIILRTLKESTEVSILDFSENNDEGWYYVNIPNLNNINSRGWINSKSFTVFYDAPQNITK